MRRDSNLAEIHDDFFENMWFQKSAILKYYAKSSHHDAEQWPEWMVDISLTHTVQKSGIFEVASRHASIHSNGFGKSATFEITLFSDQPSWISAKFRIPCYKFNVKLWLRNFSKALCKLQQDKTIYIQHSSCWPFCHQRLLARSFFFEFVITAWSNYANLRISNHDNRLN